MNRYQRGSRRGHYGSGGRENKETQYQLYAPVQQLLIGTLTVQKNRTDFRINDTFARLNPSPGLFFQRMVPVRQQPRWQGKYSELRPKVFKEWIEKVWQKHLNEWKDLCSVIHGRMKELANQLQQRGWYVREGVLTTADRLVVGLGQTSFWEVGMTWHRPTGLPYIPASALKGITRAKVLEPWYARAMDDYIKRNPPPVKEDEMKKWIEKMTEQVNKAVEQVLVEDKRVHDLLGIQEYAGRAVFLDAFPVKPPKFVIDIMNVHYPSYYQGEGEADDTENPNPITFLAIEKGSPFYFAVAVRTNAEDAGLVWQMLTSALAERGVGSKTRLGYGRFSVSGEN